MELELADLQQQLDELFKSKQEVFSYQNILTDTPVAILSFCQFCCQILLPIL
jgi:hypothetical protein